MSVENHIVRGEHILVGFLRGFFKQDQLFKDFPNEFQYTDGRDNNSLIIQMVDNYDQETEDATPALILQSGGFRERMERIDQRESHDWTHTEHKKASLDYNYSLHCIAREKGTTKFLQAAASKGLMGFRKAIYEMGVNKIHPMSGGAPNNIGSPDNDHPGPYDAPIRLQVTMDQDFLLLKGDEPEEVIEIKSYAAVQELEYNPDGTVATPSSEWFSQEISQ